MIKRFLLFAVLLLSLFALGETPLVRTFDWKSTDLLVRGHFADPDIVILAVDDKSIQTIGRWPWPRSVEAGVFAKLRAANPRAVGVDINFTEMENPGEDAALVASVASAQFPVILPVETIAMSDGTSRLLLPLESLRSLANVATGHINAFPASDGNARFLPPTLSGNIEPFAEKIAQAAGGVLPPTDRRYAISFAGPAGSFATYSISDFLSGAIPAEAISEKIILIGSTASDLHDTVLVPARGGTMAGVEWHANIVDNILLNRLLAVAPPAVVNFAAVVLAALLLILFRRIRTVLAVLITAAVLTGIPVISYLALGAHFLIPFFWSDIVILAAFFAHALEKWYATEMEKRRLRRSVQNYFSPAVLDAILKNPKNLALGGERKEVSILFSDIRSFTTIAERTPPEQLSKLLHEYFTEMAEEVFATDGVLDKFIGDAIMAFWGAPLEQPDHADRAVETARGMVRRLAILQKKWAAEGLPFVDIGIGVHTGQAIVGNMGSVKRFDYTVIGDAVNAASRLEGLNKEYQTHIIISDATRRSFKRPFPVHKLGDVAVKGKTNALTIYRVD